MSEFFSASFGYFVFIDDVKAEVSNFINDGLLAERGSIKGNGGIFGSETDFCSKNTVHLFKIPCDSAYTAFAVHAGDREVNLVFHGIDSPLLSFS